MKTNDSEIMMAEHSLETKNAEDLINQALGIAKKTRQFIIGYPAPISPQEFLQRQLNAALGVGSTKPKLQKPTSLIQEDDMEWETDLQVTTLADFLIGSMCHSFKLQQNQAAALLTSNQKYLVHLCIKGMKGYNYTRLNQWYEFLINKVSKFADLCEIEKYNPVTLKMVLNAIKCGLYSRNYKIAELCATFMIKMF